MLRAHRESGSVLGFAIDIGDLHIRLKKQILNFAIDTDSDTESRCAGQAKATF
jgi:hypothetical protein